MVTADDARLSNLSPLSSKTGRCPMEEDEEEEGGTFWGSGPLRYIRKIEREETV
jgi:hypothetical protein